jgi:hypothetical protein
VIITNPLFSSYQNSSVQKQPGFGALFVERSQSTELIGGLFAYNGLAPTGAPNCAWYVTIVRRSSAKLTITGMPCMPSVPFALNGTPSALPTNGTIPAPIESASQEAPYWSDWAALGSAAPTAGTWTATWNQGDVITNTAPTVEGPVGSQYCVTGWLCTAGSTPAAPAGTWVPMRSLTGT